MENWAAHAHQEFPAVLACKNIRFSSLFVAGDVSRETSPAAKSEEKRMFPQATAVPAPRGICTMSFETIIACVADAKRGGGEGEKRESGEKGRERLLRRGWCICIAPTIFSTKPITSYVENGTSGK